VGGEQLEDDEEGEETAHGGEEPRRLAASLGLGRLVAGVVVVA